MRSIRKHVAWTACAALVMGFSVATLAQSEQPNQSPVAAVVPARSPGDLPDSPSAVQAQLQPPAEQEQNSAAQTPAVTPSAISAAPQQGQTQNPQPPPVQEPQTQRPVGTAAAEAPMVSGITAAQPAGVAIAPARQRRVRTIVLKVGAIVGAGVALGTTIALTAGTSSKPPGAH